jgi:hypothetical protein
MAIDQHVVHQRAIQGVGVGCPNARVDASNGNRDGCRSRDFDVLLNVQGIPR